MSALLPQHSALIRESAISEQVAVARGYRSVTEKRELNGLFGPVQQRTPGLLIPLHDVYGERRSYQLRPDDPRVGKDGKQIKYETPRGLKMMLDCPPSTLGHVRDPKVTLWVTEGVRKADALASVGLRAIALLGVDCWRGTNEMNGKTTLEDWFGVALNGRKVVVCFDSDAFEKPAVHSATERLGRWLETRGAELAFVYLPHAADGSKQGVDDYLAGHDRDELLSRIEGVWHPLPHQTVSGSPDPKSNAPLTPTAELIAEVAAVLDRFVVLPSRAAVLAVSLFALHTFAFDAAHCTPYLVVQSPVKRAGKSRFEEVLELLVRAPWRIAAASESALFRKIDLERPTLLLDEVDALFGRSAEANEPIRAVLNAGNRPGAAVARVVGEGSGMTVADFSVFCPKVLAGIHTSRWPDTVIDRSIRVQMRRRKPTERVERFRYRTARAQTEGLRERLARWAQEHSEALLEAEPRTPPELDDRAAEAWECLLAIAELADREGGEGWAQRARAAAVNLAEAEADDDAHGVAMLHAIRVLIGDEDAIHTSTIVEAVNADEQMPFGEYRKGAGVNARGLTKLLKPFAINSHNVRVDGQQAKGYRREQFVDSWARYCENPPTTIPIRPSVPIPIGTGVLATFPIRPTDASGTASVPPESPVNTDVGTLGRIETPNPGSETQNGANRRTVADISDDELLAEFPGAELEPVDGEPVAKCGCGKRSREWRLRGPAVDVTCAYLANGDYRDAVASGRDVIAKGPASGWVYETAPLDHGHAWQCSLCHPPADGLDVESRELAPEPEPSGRLRWRAGYGWRRDGEPDGRPLAPTPEPPDPICPACGQPIRVDERYVPMDGMVHETCWGDWVKRTRPEPPAPEPSAARVWVDPNAPPIMDRYADRPEKRARSKRMSARGSGWSGVARE